MHFVKEPCEQLRDAAVAMFRACRCLWWLAAGLRSSGVPCACDRDVGYLALRGLSAVLDAQRLFSRVPAAFGTALHARR